MPRGNKNNDYRARGGSRDHGRGRGRGGSNRGVPNTDVPVTAPANRGPRRPYPHTNAEIDVVIQQWPEPYNGPGVNWVGNVNRVYGPWRGGTPKSRSGLRTPSRGTDSPRRGASTPRGWDRGRGRGRGWDPNYRGVHSSASRRPHLGVGVGIGGKAKIIIKKDAPLSDLLYSERPLLRPVKFVRATLTPFLFQHSEDVLKPAIEVPDMTEASHVPTADRVARVFRRTRTGTTSDSDEESEGHAQDTLEEIDFADLAQVRAEVDAIASGTTVAAVVIDEDVPEGEEDLEVVDFADLAAMRAKVDAAKPWTTSEDDIVRETFTGMYNQIKDPIQASSTMDVIDDNQSYGVQQTTSLPISPTLADSPDLKQPSFEISNSSNHKSHAHDRDTIVVEEEVVKEEVPYSPNVMQDMPVQEPSLYRTPETHMYTDDILPHPDAPSHDDPHPLFVVDTAPTFPLTDRSASDVILVDRTGHGEALGDEDEERIVYVAPNPRSRHVSTVPAVPTVELTQTFLSTGRSFEGGGLTSPVREDDGGSMMLDRGGTCVGLEAEAGEDQYLSLASLTLEPTTSTSPALHTRLPRANATLRTRKKGKRRQRQHDSKRGRLGFGAFGAMASEARLREENMKDRLRPRWETRRRGDSDIDWGTEDEDEDEDQCKAVDGEESDAVDMVSDAFGGMEIDPDLEMDVGAMEGFLKSMSLEGSTFVTMDNVEDEARIREEGEEGDGGPDGSSGSERTDEEVELDDDKEDSDDDDDELSPRSSFQARLHKLRERSHGQRPKTAHKTSDDEEDDTPEFLPWTRSANDEEYIAHINDLIEENSQIISAGSRKQRNAVFRNLHQGYVDVEAFLDDPEFTTPVNKKKGKKGKSNQTTEYFDAELEAQWAKDRAKKAEYKRKRQAAQLLAALDPLSADGRARRHTSRKAMRAAARLDPTAALSVSPHAIVDIVSLEAQMRRFVEDIEGRSSLALPPMDRWMRKQVHEMAAAFGVKSMSKGQDTARYTTLIRTTKTGVRVNESKVRALIKRYSRKGYDGGKDGKESGRSGGKGGRMPRQREGDEVGKEAPKIGESNIGFRMLASMGWSEGDRIGGTASVGIETPLTAIIKNSKLGLGATR